MLYIGKRKAESIHLGNKEVENIYLGETLLWERDGLMADIEGEKLSITTTNRANIEGGKLIISNNSYIEGNKLVIVES